MTCAVAIRCNKVSESIFDHGVRDLAQLFCDILKQTHGGKLEHAALITQHLQRGKVSGETGAAFRMGHDWYQPFTPQVEDEPAGIRRDYLRRKLD